MNTDSKTNEIYAYFRLSGVDLDPDEITKIVGVKPTQTWKTGDVVVRSRGKPTIRKFSVWKVKSKLAPSEELDPTRELEIHIESVFEQLQPGWQQLAQISYQYEALICCVVYAYSHVPAISFNQQIIHKASELSAGIDLDMYCRLNWKKQEQE
ncbi:DUF4279 domain-containing protein [Coleofasciculus chthonoplastes]|uniref:DUF4279 domain-containing protein n=1 Tax=Coleofasciculus chthonoplastes TaxID=64178 RepID=UPI0008FED28B